MMQAVKDWLNTYKNSAITEVIEADQNAPRPELPFITVKELARVEDENAYVSEPSDDGLAEVFQNQTATFSIQCFGDGAMSFMQELKTSLDKPSVHLFLRQRGAIYVRLVGGLTDISEVLGTKFEKRANMDLEFRQGIETQDDIGLIERVIGTGTMDGETSDFDTDNEAP